MNTKSQYGFEQIKVSDRLDEVVKKAIERAKKEKKEKKEKSLS
jgi:hydroxylamine reductase (hybrid-cluster protein)